MERDGANALVRGTRIFDQGSSTGGHNILMSCPVPGCERMMRKEAKMCEYHSRQMRATRSQRQAWAKRQLAAHMEGRPRFLAGDIAAMVEAFVAVAGPPNLKRWKERS